MSSEQPEVMPDQQTGGEIVEIQPQREIAQTTMAAEVEALVKAKFAMAAHRPRDVDQARSKILGACRRPAFADAAIYRVPRGGSKIEGPSIRFAEEAVRCMGNIDVQVRTVFEDEMQRKVRVDVLDLESNTTYSAEALFRKTLERRQLKRGQTPIGERVNSYGDTVYLVEATEDDLLVKQNALISKAIRTNGLRLVPSDIVEEAMAECRATSRNRDAEDPEGARKKMLDAFDGLGVKPAALKEVLGLDPHVLSPADLASLRELYAALESGSTTWAQVIEERKGEGEDGAGKASSARERAAAKAKAD